MTTLTLEESDLIDRLQQIATEQGTSPEELLNVAVKEFLDRQDEQQLLADDRAYQELHEQLVTQYLGQYVAIYNGEVVDADPDLTLLNLRVRKTFGHTRFLFRQVTQ